jgi:hypothetical protein
MSSERFMRNRVIRALKPLHAVSVENGCGPGTPDVNCTTCWIELKSLPAWPKRPETPVRIDHLTPQQRVWLWARDKAGGAAWLLLKVADDWLLFQPPVVTAPAFGREWPKQMLINVAAEIWFGGLVDAELLEVIREAT